MNSGAPIIFADCQIVFGDNATLLGDILKKDTAHASTTQDPQGVDPKFKTEKAKAIFKKLAENGYTHTEGSSYVWDVSQAEYGYMVYIVSDLLISSILLPTESCGWSLELYFRMLRVWRVLQR